MVTVKKVYTFGPSLPRHIIPDHYDIELTPIIKEGNFTTSGSVKLTFTVSEEETFQSVKRRCQENCFHQNSIYWCEL